MNYTDAQKAEAVDLYVEVGTAEAARRVGTTTRTITRWASAAGVVSADRAKKVEHTVEGRDAANKDRRSRIRDKVLAKAEDLLDRMDEKHIDFRGKDNKKVTFPKATSGDVRNYAVSFGVLLDKYRLEMGEATEVVITGDMMDQAIIELRADIGQDASSQ